jgi:hypothetical protein
MGMKAVKNWNLPNIFHYGVRFHHTPHLGADYIDFVTTIHTADHLVKKMKIGNSGDDVVPQLQETAYSLFPFSDEEWNELCENILMRTKDARTFLTI